MNKKTLTVTKLDELQDRTIRFVISTNDLDRDGDILDPKGCDIENFMKNPVFLPFHDYDKFPLGKVVGIEKGDDGIRADVYFPTVEELSTDAGNASEHAKTVDFAYHCYKMGMLSAVSVGFYTRKRTDNVITEWELLEFSAVSLPANQNALVEAVKSLGMSLKSDDTPPEPPAPAEPKRSNVMKACRDKVRKIIEMLNELSDDLEAGEGSPNGNDGEAPNENDEVLVIED